MPTTARLHVAERAELLTPDTARPFFERMVRVRAVESWPPPLYAKGACGTPLGGTAIDLKWPFPQKPAAPGRRRASLRPEPLPC
jgi:hypothetical protein